MAERVGEHEHETTHETEHKHPRKERKGHLKAQDADLLQKYANKDAI